MAPLVEKEGIPMVKALRRIVPIVAAVLVLGLTASIASADGPGWKTVSQDFHGLLFGLNVGQNGQLLVADSGAGPTKLDPDSGDTALIASLPNVSDVIQVGRREYMALTGGGGDEGSPAPPGSATLYRIKDGDVTAVADLGKFEADHDADGAGVDSNPYHLVKLSRNKTLVADAGGNDILMVDKDGNIDWVAVLPKHEYRLSRSRTLRDVRQARPTSVACLIRLRLMPLLRRLQLARTERYTLRN
jgi:hypothetical protein